MSLLYSKHSKASPDRANLRASLTGVEGLCEMSCVTSLTSLLPVPWPQLHCLSHCYFNHQACSCLRALALSVPLPDPVPADKCKAYFTSNVTLSWRCRLLWPRYLKLTHRPPGLPSSLPCFIFLLNPYYHLPCTVFHLFIYLSIYLSDFLSVSPTRMSVPWGQTSVCLFCFLLNPQYLQQC